MSLNQDPDFHEKIREGLDKIRPYLQADGGDITLLDVTDDMVVRVKLLGACGTCPMSVQTLKAGVEFTLKRMMPEIKEVVNVPDGESFE
ncbi:MAG: NifU family protein [Bacteroidales bacterium]|nr:NifU family protein [Bacteroidales bacterium]MCF8457240.1 NifU family protein [Bacteroidales bacterium]